MLYLLRCLRRWFRMPDSEDASESASRNRCGEGRSEHQSKNAGSSGRSSLCPEDCDRPDCSVAIYPSKRTCAEIIACFTLRSRGRQSGRCPPEPSVLRCLDYSPALASSWRTWAMLVRNLQKTLPWVIRAREGWQTAAVSTSAALLKPERPEPVPISKLYDNFLDGTSSTYLEELERKYQSDPNSVDKSWASFFSMAGEAAATWLSCGQLLCSQP